MNDRDDCILIVRLGAMGDIIHALPAAASLRASFPDRFICWLVAPRWMPLLEGNPAIDRLIPFERHSWSQLRSTAQRLWGLRPAHAFDFQGLLKSAIAGRASSPKIFWGFDRRIAREPLAAALYSHALNAPGPHRVESNLQLVAAAGARSLTTQAFVPQGVADGLLPGKPYVLASPFAGWPGKEWPLSLYPELAERLTAEGLALVLNVPAVRKQELTLSPAVQNGKIHVHTSSLAGLIHATRQSVAVIGLDSGPLHLAAALNKPGVAIFGPTDPAQTGPFGGSISVLRAPNVNSTYKRDRQIHGSMQGVSVDQVLRSLMRSIESRKSLQSGLLDTIGHSV